MPPALFPMSRTVDSCPSRTAHVQGPCHRRRARLRARAATALARPRPADGKPLWRVGGPRGRAGRAPSLLALREADGTVWGIEPASGLRALEGRVGDRRAPLPPVFDGDRVLVAGDGHRGPRRRRAARVSGACAADAVATLRRAPRRRGPLVIVGEADGTRARARPGTGSPLWTCATGGAALREPRRPTARDGSSWAPAARGFVALHAENGHREWRWKVGADVRTRRRARWATRWSFASHEAVLYALRRGGGNLSWRATLPSRPLGGAAALRRHGVIVACHGLAAVREPAAWASTGVNGRPLGELRTPAEIEWPAAAPGRLAVLRRAARRQPGGLHLPPQAELGSSCRLLAAETLTTPGVLQNSRARSFSFRSRPPTAFNLLLDRSNDAMSENASRCADPGRAALVFACGGSRRPSRPPPATTAAAAPAAPAPAGGATAPSPARSPSPARAARAREGQDRGRPQVRRHAPAGPGEAASTVKDGGLAHAFVWLKSGVSGSYPVAGRARRPRPAGLQYHPHVVGVQAGQTITIKNSDDTLHNIHPRPTVNAEFNIGQARKGMESQRTFDKQEIMIPVGCDVHPWMRSYISVVDHPFFAVTKDDGTYEIKNVPAGRLRGRGRPREAEEPDPEGRPSRRASRPRPTSPSRAELLRLARRVRDGRAPARRPSADVARMSAASDRLAPPFRRAHRRLHAGRSSSSAGW